MRTNALATQLRPAVSATVFAGKAFPQSADKEKEEKQKEEITYIYRRGQDEKEITEDARRHQPQKVKNSGSRGKLSKDIVQDCQHHDDEQPYTSQEHRQDERHFEGRKRGIEVEMFPRFGHKDLHGFVDHGTESHQQTERKRIYTVDVVEIDNRQLIAPKSPIEVEPHEEGENADEVRRVRVTEKIDGLRNAVGGNERTHKFPFAYPALSLLRMGELYPNAVHCVGRMHGELGHDYAVAFVKMYKCIFNGQALQSHGILNNLEVGVPRVVPLVEMAQGIAGLVREVFGIRIGSFIVATRQSAKTDESAENVFQPAHDTTLTFI